MKKIFLVIVSILTTQVNASLSIDSIINIARKIKFKNLSTQVIFGTNDKIKKIKCEDFNFIDNTYTSNDKSNNYIVTTVNSNITWVDKSFYEETIRIIQFTDSNIKYLFFEEIDNNYKNTPLLINGFAVILNNKCYYFGFYDQELSKISTISLLEKNMNDFSSIYFQNNQSIFFSTIKINNTDCLVENICWLKVKVSYDKKLKIEDLEYFFEDSFRAYLDDFFEFGPTLQLLKDNKRKHWYKNGSQFVSMNLR